MIKTALNTTAPFFAGAIGGSTGSSLLGLQPGTLGTGLLILMALAVIANQLWTLFDKARRAIRSPEADTANLATVELCDQRHHEIEKALAGLMLEDERQDRINKDHFETITAALVELKHNQREDTKGLHKRTDDVLRAVSRLEGKVS